MCEIVGLDARCFFCSGFWIGVFDGRLRCDDHLLQFAVPLRYECLDVIDAQLLQRVVGGDLAQLRKLCLERLIAAVDLCEAARIVGQQIAAQAELAR